MFRLKHQIATVLLGIFLFSFVCGFFSLAAAEQANEAHDDAYALILGYDDQSDWMVRVSGAEKAAETSRFSEDYFFGAFAIIETLYASTLEARFSLLTVREKAACADERLFLLNCRLLI